MLRLPRRGMCLALAAAMRKAASLVAVLLTTTIATLSWQKTASACGGGSGGIDGGVGLDLFIGTTLLDIPPIILGTGDLLMTGSKREPTRGYAIAETIVSVPALAMSTTFAVATFVESDWSNGRGFAVVAMAIPALTLAHGIKWTRIHRRRRIEAKYGAPSNAPGMQAAARVAPFADSSGPKASWQLATMPVSDGKSVGAGVGVIGRF